MADRSTKVVLPFPRKVRRRSKKASAAATAASVYAIPTSRHRTMVASVAKEMRAQPTQDAAEDFLTWHLNLEFGRLERLGIPEAEAEQHCRDFAWAAWRAVFVKISSKGEDVA